MSIAELHGNTFATSQPDRSSPAMRIAIVGCGPRGLYCLESLLRKLRSSGENSRVEIVIYEPTPWLGAGNVYCPIQPSYLRMNFATRFIDAWADDGIADQVGGETSFGRRRESLTRWLEKHHPHHSDPNGYAPRALVGDYLMDCFDQVARECPDSVSIQVIAEKVVDAVPYDGRWRLSCERDSSHFDEVVFATGHGGLRNGKLIASDGRAFAIPVIKDVFPVSENLGKVAVAPKSIVAIRGFGLTWIDATLALTEGRGGRFEETDGQLVYESTGDEPQLILPFCRSGRPMLAKPELGKLRINASKISKLEAIWKRGSEQILGSSQSRDSFTREIWPIVTQSAAKALVAISTEGEGQLTTLEAHKAIHGWFENWLTQDGSAETVERMMRHSVELANDAITLDEAWAMGEAWRKLYPALVNRISHGGLVDESNPNDDSNWMAFATTAREMEKIAFGPPAINLRKLLALIDAKILCLDALIWNLNACGELSDPNASDNDQNAVLVDVLVNAVIPATTYHLADSPLGKLIDRQQMESMPGGQTIKVSDSGRPFGPDEGLAIFGRATEGCVLGNDTLSRKLHLHIERWAARVVQKSQRVSSPSRHAQHRSTSSNPDRDDSN